MKKHISLSITERCNLNCIYCFEKSKKQETMSFETAIRVLTNELENSPDFEEISCDFMGGEPFLEFNLIKDICEYFWSHPSNKKISFYTTTNGTLVHGEIKEWLRKNQNRFSCMLSLDGCEDSHNINRSNSYSKIDIPFFLEMWPDMKVKGITSQKTLKNLCENVVHLHELGFKNVEMKLAYGFDWNDAAFCQTLECELRKLKAYYLSHPSVIPCSLLNVDFLRVNYPGKEVRKWCNAGYNTVSYDMRGNLYPCRYFQDLVKTKHMVYDEIWKYDYKTIQHTLSGKCKNCLIRDLCRTCYAYNYEQSHDFGVKDMVACRITRITMTVASELVIEKKLAGITVAPNALENAHRICKASSEKAWYIE